MDDHSKRICKRCWKRAMLLRSMCVITARLTWVSGTEGDAHI